MSKESHKTAVLEVLEQQPNSVALKEILDILGPTYAERSVRRWLSELAQEGLVIKTGQKSGTRYAVIPKFSLDAEKSIHYVEQPIFNRMPAEYNKSWLSEYIPNHTYYLATEARRKLHKFGRRDHKDDSAGTYAKNICNRLLIDLSFNSSRLEGNTYSILDTEKLIFEGMSAEGKLDGEKIMILNHKEAIRHLIDFAPTIEITTTEICTLHYLLSDGLLESKYTGKLRDHGVGVSGSTYAPIESKSELEQLLATICHKANMIQDPFEQSFFLLVHISYLQAFGDVNKRTARLSANIPLIKKNFVPISFNFVDTNIYLSAMIAIYELNDPQPLAEIYTNSYLRSCRSYDINENLLIYNVVRVRYRDLRRELVRKIILEKIYNEDLLPFIESELKNNIPSEDKEAFINTIQEDLSGLSAPTIVGLGISKEDMLLYLNSKPSK